MSQVYSTRFFASHAGTAASYTVPDGCTAVIRTITAFNASVLAPETAAVVLTDLDVTIWQNLLTPGPPDVPNESSVVNCRVVLRAGESIHNIAGSDIDMTVSGYELTAASS